MDYNQELINLSMVMIFSFAVFVFFLINFMKKQQLNQEKIMISNATKLVERIDELEEKLNEEKENE